MYIYIFWISLNSTLVFLWSRQGNRGEDQHLRHQLWSGLRHRHGESRCLLWSSGYCWSKGWVDLRVLLFALFQLLCLLSICCYIILFFPSKHTHAYQQRCCDTEAILHTWCLFMSKFSSHTLLNISLVFKSLLFLSSALLFIIQKHVATFASCLQPHFYRSAPIIQVIDQLSSPLGVLAAASESFFHHCSPTLKLILKYILIWSRKYLLLCGKDPGTKITTHVRCTVTNCLSGVLSLPNCTPDVYFSKYIAHEQMDKWANIWQENIQSFHWRKILLCSAREAIMCQKAISRCGKY